MSEELGSAGPEVYQMEIFRVDLFPGGETMSKPEQENAMLNMALSEKHDDHIVQEAWK